MGRRVDRSKRVIVHACAADVFARFYHAALSCPYLWEEALNILSKSYPTGTTSLSGHSRLAHVFCGLAPIFLC